MITASLIFPTAAKTPAFIEKWAVSADFENAKTRAPPRQTTFLLARALVRASLASCTPGPWHIHAEAGGKLFLLDDANRPGPAFSLSHTPGLITCAIADAPHTPIGIDAEVWRDRDFEKLAQYAFGPEEQAAVTREGAAAFYRIWTLREAMAKCLGRGMMEKMDGTDQVRPHSPSIFWSNNEWQFYYALPRAGLSLALAAQGQPAWAAPRLTWLDIPY